MKSIVIFCFVTYLVAISANLYGQVYNNSSIRIIDTTITLLREKCDDLGVFSFCSPGDANHFEYYRLNPILLPYNLKDFPPSYTEVFIINFFDPFHQDYDSLKPVEYVFEIEEKFDTVGRKKVCFTNLDFCRKIKKINRRAKTKMGINCEFCYYVYRVQIRYLKSGQFRFYYPDFNRKSKLLVQDRFAFANIILSLEVIDD